MGNRRPPAGEMMLKGAEALSDAELLAILIGSGNTEESAVTLMQRTLACCNNDLNRLGKWEVHDFSRFKGLGPAKSITIMAALELGNAENCKNIRNTPSYVRPMIFMKFSTRCCATSPSKNSGYFCSTRQPMS